MLALILTAAVAQAPEAVPAPAEVAAAIKQGVVENPDDPVYLIGKELRCPVCQGMPIADSPAEMAQDMMKKVRALYEQGKRRDEILDYFTKSYGDWVLLSPRPKGFNWLVWGLPPAAVLAAFVLMRHTMRRTRDDAKIPEADPTVEQDDDYLAMVRNEVDQ